MPLSLKDTIQGTITNAQNAATADTAGKLSANAGSTTQPVYFSGGKPVATSYTLAKSVPADAKFTDTNTWRGIQNNLTSDSTTDSLSAAQGKALKGLVDGKAASGHTHDDRYYTESEINTKLNGKSNTGHAHGAADITSGTLALARGGTGATTALDAYRILSERGYVSADADWNTLTAGVWVVAQEKWTANKNQPEGAYSYGNVVVTNNGSNISQIYIAHSQGQLWFRERFGNGNDFAQWACVSVSGHTHTKAQVGLGNVDNTADSAKSVNYANSAGAVAWGNVTGRPTSLPASDVYAWAKASTKPSYTKSEVGLSNVDNTADSAKSVKYATSAGSSGSAGSATNDSKNQAITGYIRGLSVSGRTVTYTRGDGTTGSITTQDTNTTYGTASQSTNGLMSAADKKKLDGIANGANNFTYSLPTASATVLGGVKTGSNITNTSGVLSLTKANVTSALGYTPPTTNTTYGNATTSSSGLMSYSDKRKLDGIASGANKTVVDNALSQSSANPVANSAVTKRLQFLYSFKISRDKWNESSDKSNWNVIVPWSDSSGTSLTGSTTGTPNLTTGMSLGPAMMERTSSLNDNIILSGELSMINQGQIYVCDTNKLSFTVKRRPVCDLMLYFYARQWTT